MPAPDASLQRMEHRFISSCSHGLDASHSCCPVSNDWSVSRRVIQRRLNSALLGKSRTHLCAHSMQIPNLQANTQLRIRIALTLIARQSLSRLTLHADAAKRNAL